MRAKHSIFYLARLEFLVEGSQHKHRRIQTNAYSPTGSGDMNPDP